MVAEIAQQITFTEEITPEYETILTPEAIEFVAKLARHFTARRDELLHARQQRQDELDAGVMPDFLPETYKIRAANWRVASIPEDLQDRRVEITGPTERKMVINALNSGASVFMADFEDANAPSWENMVQGQINLRDAVRKTITFTNDNGKHYSLNKKTAVLMVRPRGWHLNERHMIVDGAPVPGAIFDFGLYFYHNVHTLLEHQTGPYFYLPKLESHLEARLWNDIFNMAQDALEIPRRTIKATVLIETILASFEMDEILWELRDHSAGLNCGRWDYIFSVIKKFRQHKDFLMPDRSQVTMTTHFMRSYSLLVIKTCHRRGAHAMGGMAAQIPIKHDAQANDVAFAKVRADKEREAKDGHDGTWVAHPGLVAVAKEVFDKYMPQANQISEMPRHDVNITADDLLCSTSGTITEDGLMTNLKVGIQYTESWLGGNGCVPLYHLMEDAATAEISRSQVWQWLHHGSTMTNGQPITQDYFEAKLVQAMDDIKEEIGDERFNNGHFQQAASLFKEMIEQDTFTEFLTLPAYQYLN